MEYLIIVRIMLLLTLCVSVYFFVKKNRGNINEIPSQCETCYYRYRQFCLEKTVTKKAGPTECRKVYPKDGLCFHRRYKGINA